ncbi:MAG: pilus assembly protein [Alphaproteobacteria bacterium]|nr:pilus assembly protein [Alphaproteobacteria bacterium]
MRLLRSFARDTRASAGVEFALIAPGMIAMLFGMIEVNELIIANNRTLMVASSVADVASRSTSIKDADVSGLFEAAGTVMYPGSKDSLKLRLSSVAVTGAGKGTVQWSDARSYSPYSPGSNLTLPDTVENPCTGPSIIYAEAEFTYVSPVGMVLGVKPYALKQQVVMCPRVVDNVSRIA